MQLFTIVQNIWIANGQSEWFDIDSYSVEYLAWIALDKYKAAGFEVELIKRTETQISE